MLLSSVFTTQLEGADPPEPQWRLARSNHLQLLTMLPPLLQRQHLCQRSTLRQRLQDRRRIQTRACFQVLRRTRLSRMTMLSLMTHLLLQLPDDQRRPPSEVQLCKGGICTEIRLLSLLPQQSREQSEAPVMGEAWLMRCATR